MSRIGKKAIAIPSGVKVELKGQHVKVTGAQGSLEMNCHPLIKVKVDSSVNAILLENDDADNSYAKQLHGTMRALVANMVTGVSKGFEKRMEIYGTGYNLKEQGGELVLQVGFCNPVELPIPNGIKVKIEVPATKGNDTPAKFTVFGIDKAVLGQFAVDIRRVKPPEPYQGKGIRYADEHVKRKVGKAIVSGTV